MADQYEADLERSTEVVLTRRNRVQRTEPRRAVEDAGGKARRAVSGSAGRAAAGAVSVGSALGAALTNRRTLGPAEVGLLGTMAVITLAIAIVAVFEPRVLAYPIAALTAWLGIAWGWKALALWRRAHQGAQASGRPEADAPRAGAKQDAKDGIIES
jgi:cardiolipin synthase